jgi:Zn-dependent protease with chaperone function
MTAGLAIRSWGVTFALVLAAAASVAAILRTGANPAFVALGVGYLVVLAGAAWRSGGRFEFDARGGRPLSGRDPPAIRRAVLRVCERADAPVPTVLVVEMDVPGAMVGRDDGHPVVAVDPRVLWVVGPEGLEALVAHELGHLSVDLHADAVRQYLPQVVGFGVFWTVLLRWQSPTVATLGSLLYVGLAPFEDWRALSVRSACSLGAEPLALAASRYANRVEELRADAYAAAVVSPATLTEALYRLAAVATGDNDEDVAGPVPWEADRSALFSAFATHPSIERRARFLGCSIPEWARPYRPRARSRDGREGSVGQD